MARTIKDNKYVIQSYLFTTAKYKSTKYEQRIVYRLIEYAQSELQGILIRDNLHKIEHTLWNREITMPVADILCGENDKNYTKAKQAFKKLACKGIEYENEEMWSFTNIISSPKITFRSGVAKFLVDNAIWDCLLNFSKGYRKYELLTAMSFQSVYSMRMYELVSGQNKPIPEQGYIPIDELRERFGLLKRAKDGSIIENKYKMVGHFKARVLDVAKKELDASSPYSFSYVDVMEGRKIVGFRFFPIFRPEKQDQKLLGIELQAKLTGSNQVQAATYECLRYTLGFSAKEINANKRTIIKGEEAIPNFVNWLSSLYSRANGTENPRGYVINAIKQKCKELNSQVTTPKTANVVQTGSKETKESHEHMTLEEMQKELFRKYKI